jgi:dTDP-4-amino-4,6-dideoxygalactose transaminase
VSWRVPLTDVRMRQADVDAVLECLRSGWLTMGPRTAAFEEAVAEYLGVEHAVAVSSGTAALHLACLAAGLGPGDEAIVPGITFVATAAAVRYTGADPVICEVRGARDMNIDPDDVERRITPRTKAVIAVHFAGYAAPITELRALCDRHGLALIEDCAQGIGAIVDDEGHQAGAVGDYGCYSLFSKKQLCVGEGGILTTHDPAVAARAKSLRAHGLTSGTWDRHRAYSNGYDVSDIGFNYRIDEPRAALALSRLSRLDEDIEARRAVARAYRARLSLLDGLELPWDDDAVARGSHFAFPVVLPDRASRDRFRLLLQERGVQTTYYPALHCFSAYRRLLPGLSLPRVEDAADRHCAVPLCSHLEAADLEVVIEAIEETVPRLLAPVEAVA